MSSGLYRPLGQSVFGPTPWDDRYNDTYVPSEMSVDALRVGLAKSHDPKLLLPEPLVQMAERYFVNRLQSIWYRQPDDMVMSYQDAVATLDMRKSPGHPYHHQCQTKGDAMAKYGRMISNLSDRVMSGEEIPCYCNLTLKSELRALEKVKLHKTRVFMAAPLHHLIPSIRLFARQNDMLMDTIGSHPITIGIKLPGPEFTHMMRELGTRLNDGDVDGCDLRFHLRVARAIRNIRSHFLPAHYFPAIHWLYCTVYCGLVVGIGAVWRLYGNKSGWFNTGFDNSLMTWFFFVLASFNFYPESDPDEIFRIRVNGDDNLTNMLQGELKVFVNWWYQYGFYLEVTNFEPRSQFEVVFLSHTLVKRFVEGFGDIVVAAGNREKLLSSLNWVKKSKTLSFEEANIAHLLGLRLCLFPWKDDFIEVDELLSRYLENKVVTPFIQQALKARLTEFEMAVVHTRSEGLFSFISPFNAAGLNVIHRIKELLGLKQTKKFNDICHAPQENHKSESQACASRPNCTGSQTPLASQTKSRHCTRCCTAPESAAKTK